MKSLLKNKAFLIVSTICLVLLAFLTFCIYQYNLNEKNPVTFEYNEDNGIISFKIQPKYELERYKTINSNGDIVEFNSSAKTITFDVNDVQRNRSEYIIFNCKRVNSNNQKPVFPCKYEILRANNETCIMSYNEYDILFKTISYPPLLGYEH